MLEADEVARQDQVPGGRDGKELGKALDDAEDECINEIGQETP